MVFGLIIDWISSPYHQEVWHGVREYCREREINLMTLVTGRLGAPGRWEQRHNQILEFVDSHRFDGFLLTTASLGAHLNQDQIRQLLVRVSPAPVVSIGAELEHRPALLVDNRCGLEGLLEHLYRDHGHRRFAYIGGPDHNADARERKSVLVSFVRDKNLALDPGHVLSGPFTTAWGREAILRLIPEGQPNFDALICANDDIAMGALEELNRRGIAVPDTLAVTGFDDLIIAAQAGLTTARQPLAALGQQAAALLLDEIEGRPTPRVIRLGTEPILRQSCGCLSPASRELVADPVAPEDRTVADLSSDEFPEALAVTLAGAFTAAGATDSHRFLSRIRSLIGTMDQAGIPPGALHHPLSVLRRWVRGTPEPSRYRDAAEVSLHQARILVTEALHRQAVQKETRRLLVKDLLSSLNERLLASRNFADQAAIFLDLFPQLGVSSFRLAMYDGQDRAAGATRLVLTERGEVPGGLGYNPQDLFAPGYEPPAPWCYVAEALFDRNTPLGFFLLDAEGDRGLLAVFDQICERVGRGLETMRRIQDLEDQVGRRTEELREALADLELYAVQLKELALRDELTGLYNRRGFQTLAEHQIKAHWRSPRPMVLFFGDMDGLKTINDTGGHGAGDAALRITARLLTETFRAEDVVARWAGDEFVILAPGCTEETASLLGNRLDAAFAAAEGGRYGLSLGWIVVDPRVRRPLIDWMKEADAALYRRKAARKGGQAR